MKTHASSLAFTLLIAAFPALAAPLPTDPGVRTERVRCDRGETLSRALGRGADVLVVEFQGTCTEEVVIRRDDVTLRGTGSNPTLIGGVTLEGASRITLEGFTSRNSALDNFALLGAHAVNLRQLRAETAGRRGLYLKDSNAVLADSDIVNPGEFGIVVSASSLTARGSVRSGSTEHAGFLINDGSTFVADNGASLESSNSIVGMVIQLGSVASFNNNVNVWIHDNSGLGLAVINGGSASYSITNFLIERNGVGLQVSRGAQFSPFLENGPSITVRNNAQGAQITRDAYVQLTGNTSITNNAGPGIFVQASMLEIRDSVVTGNGGGDLTMIFGARALFNTTSTLGTPIVCDPTVITRGFHSCGGTSIASTQAIAVPELRIVPAGERLLLQLD
jgi:hypothetical protein